MTFEELLDQALALLQRRGRVTYRTLQRQFNLDEVLLEDLKAALLYEHPQVVDDPGHGLIWRAAIPADPLRTAYTPPDAERRQLTVLFCDLVESTALAAELDPEELREVVRAYQVACAEVIQRFDGYVAQYLGDGILVYFGYPLAHEDAAQRAAHVGLAIVEAISLLKISPLRERGDRLAVRIGIHTGPVVVGEVGGGARHERLALGETPNLAARLQNLAPPNRVVISATTRRLIEGAFDVEELGPHTLKGLSTPQLLYAVRGEHTAESRFEAASATVLTPLVGRKEELGLLLRVWERAKAGEGQVVLLAGEAGIGKSRLLQTVRERIAEESYTRLQYQCSPYHTRSAFYPIIAQLERAAHFEPDDLPAQKLDKLEELLARGTAERADAAPLFASLLSIPTGDRYRPLSLSPQRQKAQTIAALVDQLVGLSRHQPVLCLVEDAQWCDPTTLEVLDQIVHRVTDLRVLALITARPEFEAPWMASHLTTLTLTRLSRAQVVTMVTQLTAGKVLPAEVLTQILAKTDGIPLFVEELTKTILESGLLREAGERYTLTGTLPPLAIPETLQDSLMARLDRLAPVKETAQLGAVLGREFTYELLAAVSPLHDQALQGALAQLVSAGLLFRRGQPPEAQYRFKHALVQEAAYASLLRSRRQELHMRIATVLGARFPAVSETEPELLAHHYSEAGLVESAVAYWRKAGRRAYERSANVEAISYLGKGLEMVKSLPDPSTRIQQELLLQTTLGPALMALKGYAAPDVEQAYNRARELCQQVGERRQLFPVLLGSWNCSFVRGELQQGRELGEQLLDLAQSLRDVGVTVRAHAALGETLFHLDAIDAARTYLEQGIAWYGTLPRRSHAVQDPGVACMCYAALALWLLGYPDQALRRSQEAMGLAEEQAHPFSLAIAGCGVAWLHQFRRDAQAARERAEAAIILATEQGFSLWVAMGTIFRGWAMAAQGQSMEGTQEIRRGLAAWRATGADLLRPYWLALLAEAHGNLGQVGEGLRLLAGGLEAAQRSGERFYEAELYRLKGEFLLAQAAEHHADAEACFHQALDIARRQQAKSWERRAAISLSRLWQQRGKRTEAYALLAPIHGWFSEGFEEADMLAAGALLNDLS